MTDHHQACCNPYTVWRACSGLSTGLHCTVPVPATSLFICYGWLYGRLMHCTLHMSDYNLKIFQDSIGFTFCFILASQMQLHHAHFYFLVLDVEALEAHIFLHLLWDFDCEFSLASYDNFFPQIRTHSQISTLPDLGHNVKRVSLSKSVTPFPLLFHYFIY